MKRLFFIISILATLLMAGGIASASDISDAIYYGVIRATNSGDETAQSVSANFTANTTAWIDAGILNSAVSNVAIRNSAGTDTAFMPGYGDNPWIVWYDNVPANGSTSAVLYTNATGGKYCVFPDTSGMTVADNATAEPGDNFTLVIKCRRTVTFNDNYTDRNFLNKDGAIKVNISANGTATANVTPDYTTPSGHNDYATWSDETLAYNGNTSDYAYEEVDGNTYSGYLGFTHSGAANCSALAFNAYFHPTDMQYIDLDAYYSGDWQGVYQGGFTDHTRVTKDLGGSYNVTEARVRFFNGDAGQWHDAKVYEFEFVHENIILTATGVDDDGQIELSADSSDISLSIDGVESDSASLGGESVLNNSSNWVFFENGVAPYVESANLTIGGAPVFNFEWEYASYLTDTLGNGYTATYTPLTTSSSENVTASLISFTPVSLANADDDIAEDWPTMVEDPPDEPSTAYTEETRPGIFFEPLVHAIWSISGLPDSFFWYNFAFFIIIAAGIFTFYFFAKNNTQALLLKCLVMFAIMIFFALPGPNIYGLYVVLYFALWCFGIMVLSKSYGW